MKPTPGAVGHRLASRTARRPATRRCRLPVVVERGRQRRGVGGVRGRGRWRCPASPGTRAPSSPSPHTGVDGARASATRRTRRRSSARGCRERTRRCRPARTARAPACRPRTRPAPARRSCRRTGSRTERTSLTPQIAPPSAPAMTATGRQVGHLLAHVQLQELHVAAGHRRAERLGVQAVGERRRTRAASR